MKKLILSLLLLFILSTATLGIYLYLPKKPTHTSLILPEPKSMLITNTPHTPTPTPKPQTKLQPTPDSAADNLLQNYYDSYLACLQQHYSNPTPKKTPSNSPQEDCPYNQTGGLTDELALKLKPIIAYDPILCTQTLPDKITYSPVIIKGLIAQAIVQEHFPDQSQNPKSNQPTPATSEAALQNTVNITVTLQQTANLWQISTITCPKQ